MGYEPKRQNVRLVFDDPEMNGLEVSCRPVSMDTFLDIATLDAGDISPVEVRRIVERFGDEILDSWNVTNDGQPVPPTLPGFVSQERTFCEAIIKAWIQALSGVPVPLDPPSPNGDTSEALSTPTVGESASLAS